MLCVDVKADDIRSCTTRSAGERKQIMLNVQSKALAPNRDCAAARSAVVIGVKLASACRSLSGGRGCGMAAAAPCLMI